MTKRLHADIKAFTKQLDAGIRQAKNEIAVYAAGALLRNSPVWTGTYVKSFRVMLNGVDPTFEPYAHGGLPFPDKMPISEGEMLKEQQLAKLISKITGAKTFDSIKISNSLPYADKVEFVGWPEFGAPPYFVFQIAQLETGAYMVRVVKGAAANGL